MIGVAAMKMFEMFISYFENSTEESDRLVSHDYCSYGLASHREPAMCYVMKQSVSHSSGSNNRKRLNLQLGHCQTRILELQSAPPEEAQGNKSSPPDLNRLNGHLLGDHMRKMTEDEEIVEILR
jgi:hypothetical protein